MNTAKPAPRKSTLKIRQYLPAQDAALVPALHQLLKGDQGADVKADRDAILLALRDDRLEGALVGHPVVMVHELEVDPSLKTMSRKVAESLIHYGMGLLHGAGHREAVFLIDAENTAMQRIVEERGAVRQPDSVVYCLKVE